MSTINYPSNGIPLNYLITLSIRNTSTCPGIIIVLYYYDYY